MLDMDPWERLALTARRHLLRTWQIAGVGWRLEGDAALARTVRQQHRHAREAAREAQRALAEVLAIAG
jgi:hypothetical protein